MVSDEVAARVERAIARWWERRDADEVFPELLAGIADQQARSHALRGLRLLGSSAMPAVPALVELLAAAREDSAAEIAVTLATIRPDDPAVLDQLVRGTAEARVRVADVLGEAGEAARGAEGALVAATRDPLPAVRWRAAGALWSVAGRADVAFPLLRREPFCEVLYADAEHELYGASWAELRKRWPGFLELLVEMVAADRSLLADLRSALASQNQAERLNGCRATYLIEGPDPTLVDPICRVLAEAEGFETWVAGCELLAALGRTAAGAAPSLERLASAVPPFWREYAERALAAIAGDSAPGGIG